MRSRITSTILGFALIASLFVPGAMVAAGQSVSQAEREAAEAEWRRNMASGLVDEAVANRVEIENQIADSISRLNDLAAALSSIGVSLDRLGTQLGFADIELAGIQEQIELQAVDAYMSVLATPTISLVSNGTVEQAMVVSIVVEDVMAGGRQRAGELFVKRRSLQELKLYYLEQQEDYIELKAELDAELQHLADLYAQADAAVADAVRQSAAADEQYFAALTAVDMARLREEERRRQEERPPPTSSTTTTTTPGPTTTTTTTPPTPTVFPPSVERWRSLVQTYFPEHRVEEALKIMRCESNGDPNAVNPYSGAAGLFQFLRSTWNSLPHSVSGGTYESGQVFDPVANTRSAAWLANRYEELGHYYWQAWSCRRVL
jgi:hypothetical protein